MFRVPTALLREKLLGVNGIGPETADSILLYAGGHESFVVDAYTHRVLARHGWIKPDADYHEIKALFEGTLPRTSARSCKRQSSLDFSPTASRAAWAEAQTTLAAALSRVKNDTSPFTMHHSPSPFPTGHPPSGMSHRSLRHSPRARLFNEYHALLVAVGKHYCTGREAKCEACPLKTLLPK
jgi:endonuclease III-like uncharacterized protein